MRVRVRMTRLIKLHIGRGYTRRLVGGLVANRRLPYFEFNTFPSSVDDKSGKTWLSHPRPMFALSTRCVPHENKLTKQSKNKNSTRSNSSSFDSMEWEKLEKKFFLSDIHVSRNPAKSRTFLHRRRFRRTDKINTVIPPMLKIPPIVKKWIETLQVLSKD